MCVRVRVCGQMLHNIVTSKFYSPTLLEPKFIHVFLKIQSFERIHVLFNASNATSKNWHKVNF